VAAFYLDSGALAAAVLALTPSCVVDRRGSKRVLPSRLCPHRFAPRLATRKLSAAVHRGSKAEAPVSLLNGSIHGRFAGSGSAGTQTTTSCSRDFSGDWREHAEGFNRDRSGTNRQEAIVLAQITIALIPSLDAGGQHSPRGTIIRFPPLSEITQN